MATACIAQVSFEFQGLRQPVVARFDQPHASSDGGALLLKALDDRLGVTERLARSLRDPRQPGKIDHALLELVRQRVYGIACGYADCNDAARLAQDPVHKLLLERDPLAGLDLASQATLSRFENAVGRQELYLASVGLADLVIEHHRVRLGGRARRITIDLDPTDDPTHGSKSSASSTGTTTRGATCRWWRR
jgi:Transposase DDE domain group 1